MLARLLGLTCRCTRDLAYEPPAVCGECGRWTSSPWGERGIRFAQSWWCVAVFAVICAVFVYWVNS